MHQGEGYVTQECLAREPQHHGGILANAPKHGQVLKLVKRLPHDVDALVF